MDEGAPARAGLDEAERLRRVVDRGTRWYAGYLAVFGAGTVLAVAAIGLIRGPLSATTVWGFAWAGFVTALGVYAVRRPAKRRGLTRVHFLTLVAMFVLLVPVLALGLTAMAGTWWWYPAVAPVVALPFFIGSWYWSARR